MAFYTFVGKEIKINNEYVKKIINFITKNLFVVYMIHPKIHFKITPKIVNPIFGVENFGGSILVTLIIFFQMQLV